MADDAVYFSNMYGSSHTPDFSGDPAYAIKGLDKLKSQIVAGRHSQGLFDKLLRMQGSPEMDVVIYRTSPVNELNRGDWVTISRDYADYIKRESGGSIHRYVVKAKDLLYSRGDSAVNGFNFGFFPK